MTTLKATMLIFWMSLMVMFPNGVAGKQPSNEVQITSDTLKIENRSKRATFLGNVKATFNSIVFSCDKVVVSYSKDGTITHLTATGNVTVKKGDATATAKTAQLNTNTNTLTLKGTPSLIRGNNKLQGKTVVVNIQTGDIDIFEASGTFIFKTNKTP